MRIQVFAISYNEEIMLPYFLKHYSEFCEKITIYDNYSTDRSLEICRQYPLVEVIQYDSGDQIRDDIYLQIKNNCWKGSTADWVIICDIDELVIVFDKTVMVPIEGHTVVMPEWFEMISEKLPSARYQIYEEINYGVSLGFASKCIMFRPDAIKEINYLPGAHGINAIGDVRILQTSEMGILHYKYLSLQYVIDRHAMYQARLSDINKQRQWGVHYNNTAQEITDWWHHLWDNKLRVI